METYVYCPFCKKINEASFVTTILRRDGVIVCQNCNKKIKQNMLVQTCEICGTRLFHPTNIWGIELPCQTRHKQDEREKERRDRELATINAKREAEQRAIQSEERVKQLEQIVEENQVRINEDEIARGMREIPCQSCPSQILRIKDGRFMACPNCHNVPTKTYIADRWKKLSGKSPEIIQWEDLSGQQIIHVDQRGAAIPPCSVLLVAHGQFVVYDGDSRRRTLRAEVYPMFKDQHTEEEKIKLLNNSINDKGEREEVLLLGLGTRIIFFSEQEHELKYSARFQFDNNKWAITLPLVITMQMHWENAENIMKHRMDLTDDATATASLESLVTTALANTIDSVFLVHEGDESLEEIETENDLKRWIIRVFTKRELEEITREISSDLSQRYGIQLPQTIGIDVSNIKVERINEMVDVSCPAYLSSNERCGFINYIKRTDFQNHNSFTCAHCGKRITWCPSCRAYVTTERIPRICDPQGHKIYR